VVVPANGAHDLVGRDASLFAPSEVGDTKLLAVHFLLHRETVGRTRDTIASKKLSEVFSIHLGSTLWVAEWKSVVIEGHERLGGRHLVHFELHSMHGRGKTSEHSDTVTVV
jgi:hypothetical protein